MPCRLPFYMNDTDAPHERVIRSGTPSLREQPTSRTEKVWLARDGFGIFS
jgi:hypothetical protein